MYFKLIRIITGVKMINSIQVDTSVFLAIALYMVPHWLMDNPVTTNQVHNYKFHS